MTFLPESRANITSTEAIIYIEDDDILEGTELFQLFIRSTEELDERLVDLLDPKKAFANIMDDDSKCNQMKNYLSCTLPYICTYLCLNTVEHVYLKCICTYQGQILRFYCYLYICIHGF